MNVIPALEPITDRARELNPRILELVFADRPLTDAEWAELEEAERNAE